MLARRRGSPLRLVRMMGASAGEEQGARRSKASVGPIIVRQGLARARVRGTQRRAERVARWRTRAHIPRLTQTRPRESFWHSQLMYLSAHRRRGRARDSAHNTSGDPMPRHAAGSPQTRSRESLGMTSAKSCIWRARNRSRMAPTMRDAPEGRLGWGGGGQVDRCRGVGVSGRAGVSPDGYKQRG